MHRRSVDLKGFLMSEVNSSKLRRTSPRTGRPSLNPFILDEIAPTVGEIRRARGGLPAAVR